MYCGRGSEADLNADVKGRLGRVCVCVCRVALTADAVGVTWSLDRVVTRVRVVVSQATGARARRSVLYRTVAREPEIDTSAGVHAGGKRVCLILSFS